MVFSDVPFLFYFFPAFMSIFALLIAISTGWPLFRRLPLVWICLASVGFYAWSEAYAAFLLLFVVFIIGLLGKVASSPRLRPAVRSRAVLCGVVGLLLLLVYFKYTEFFIRQLKQVFDPILVEKWISARWHFSVPYLDFPMDQPILPLGLSFFVFHAMSYLIDCGRGKIQHPAGPLKLTTYFFLFPHLIAGPLVRYRDIDDQLDEPIRKRKFFLSGIIRFAIGLSKKVILADGLASYVDVVFAGDPRAFSSPTLVLAVVSYSLQIYYDFSGYSDMAIGMARMMGFSFKENFFHPYSAASITEFWRRWHVSLSSWFRDYVYLPLGGNRLGRLKTFRNLLVVFLLCGLWHGAGWNFVAWGMFHGTFLILERIRLLRGSLEVLPHFLRRALIFLIVSTGWVFFRADNLTGALAYFRGIARWDFQVRYSPFQEHPAYVALLLGCGLVLALETPAKWLFGALFPWEPREWKEPANLNPGWGGGTMTISRLSVSLLCFASLLFCSLLFLVARTTQTFLYYRF